MAEVRGRDGDGGRHREGRMGIISTQQEEQRGEGSRSYHKREERGHRVTI